MKNNPRHTDLLEALRENPRASYRELAEATGMVISMVSYHLGILEDEGLITRKSNTARSIHINEHPIPAPNRRKRPKKKKVVQPNSKRWNTINRGESAFKPKRARNADELESRIDAVVAKAKAKEKADAKNAGPSVDVIRVVPGKIFRAGMKAHKVG